MNHWTSAPPWARYYAINADGSHSYFENPPIAICGIWCSRTGQSTTVKPYHPTWRTTLEAKPQATEDTA